MNDFRERLAIIKKLADLSDNELLEVVFKFGGKIEMDFQGVAWRGRTDNTVEAFKHNSALILLRRRESGVALLEEVSVMFLQGEIDECGRTLNKYH